MPKLVRHETCQQSANRNQDTADSVRQLPLYGTASSTEKSVTAQYATFSTSVPPGRYRSETEKAGLSRSAAQDCELASSARPVNVKLQSSTASETIEVIGQSPSVESAGADTGTT